MITIHCAGERRATGSLVPYAMNSRTHSQAQVEQLRASMREWGFTAPVICDPDGGIIAGHGRVLAASLEAMPEVPVVVARGWSEEQKRAYVIADNRLALNAGWDEDLLASEMAALREMGFSLDLVGFDEKELIDLFTVEDQAGEVGDDETPAPPTRPVSRVGDVWNCGGHRVMCGDATKPANVAALLEGRLADLLVIDPPWQMGADAAPGALRGFLAAALTAALTGMRPGACFYLWHVDREGYAFRAACADVGLRVRQCLVWEKPALVPDRQDYHSQHEPCLYGWKDGAAHLWATDRKQTTVLEFAKAPRADGEVPTSKPVALIEYLVKNNTKGQAVVLDLFGGAGTTLIAAAKNDRVARLMDLSPAAVDVAVTRWETFSGREAVLVSTGERFAAVRAARASADAVSPFPQVAA